jgi:hypothetical protein
MTQHGPGSSADAGSAGMAALLPCLPDFRHGLTGPLTCAHERAYGEAITGLADAAGSAAGASQLAGVGPGDVGEARGMARLPVRSETTSGDGGLFPALDADLTLAPAGEKNTVFALTGIFRLPPGVVDAGVDREMVCWFAAAAIRVFLARLASALIHPSAAMLLPLVKEEQEVGGAVWKGGTEMTMSEQDKAHALERAAQLLGQGDQVSRLALGNLWEEAFERGRLDALGDLQDRFCVCMK